MKGVLSKLRYNWNILGGRNRYKYVNDHMGFNSILLPSLEELLYQLDRFGYQKNLLQLLYYGKEHPDYKEILLQVSMKYAHLGSMSYYMPGRGCRKPPLDVYVYILVEGYHETVDEIKDHISCDLRKGIGDEEAQAVFNKFIYVMKLMLPFMACPREFYWAHYYRRIIEFVVEMDDSDIPVCKDMWTIFPLKINRKYGGEYDNLPVGLNLNEGRSDYGNIWE